MKRFLFMILFVGLNLSLHSQAIELQKNVTIFFSDSLALSSVEISDCDNCLVFSPSDWYKHVWICDGEGKWIQHFNVKYIANKLQTNKLYMCFDEWDWWDDSHMYTICMSRGKKETFIVIHDFNFKEE